MSDADDAAAVLSQVVDLGAMPTPQELELGDSVARYLTERPERPRPDYDPEVADILRPRANLTLATTDELVEELHARGYWEDQR